MFQSGDGCLQHPAFIVQLIVQLVLDLIDVFHHAIITTRWVPLSDARRIRSGDIAKLRVALKRLISTLTFLSAPCWVPASEYT